MSDPVVRARELAAAATPGPWMCDEEVERIAGAKLSIVRVEQAGWDIAEIVQRKTELGPDNRIADGIFIAESRELLPVLCDIIDDLRARDEGWKVHTVGMEELNARLTAALRAWVDWAKAAEGPIDACIMMNVVHGGEYTGPRWTEVMAKSEALLATESVTPETQ